MLMSFSVSSQCACACYDPMDLTVCVSGNCSQGNLNSCINSGLTWFQGAGSVPSGMCACEYLVIVSLAVELESIDIDCDSLLWRTSSESNCDYYLIEGSVDGYQWDYVDKVDGMNYQGGYSYGYYVGRGAYSYYRLFEFDLDGKSEGLGVVAYDCDGSNTVILSVYDMYGRYVGKSLPKSGGVYIVMFSDGAIVRFYVM